MPAETGCTWHQKYENCADVLLAPILCGISNFFSQPQRQALIFAKSLLGVGAYLVFCRQSTSTSPEPGVFHVPNACPCLPITTVDSRETFSARRTSLSPHHYRHRAASALYLWPLSCVFICSPPRYRDLGRHSSRSRKQDISTKSVERASLPLRFSVLLAAAL